MVHNDDSDDVDMFTAVGNGHGAGIWYFFPLHIDFREGFWSMMRFLLCWTLSFSLAICVSFSSFRFVVVVSVSFKIKVDLCMRVNFLPWMILCCLSNS